MTKNTKSLSGGERSFTTVCSKVFARNYVHDRKRENFSNGTTQREKESTKTERQSISDEINTKTHHFQTVNTRNC